ncbi:MAG: DUF72 domain-containing protein [Gammaproteobacteria bacterium]|nr:DUF72 domain-containing protein [Gammaproteobacteria bacterium]
MKSRIYIGTSGWSYDHWKGVFYPEELHSRDYLAFYRQRFSSVEINNTFYRLPEKKTLEHWYDSVPADFIFSVKASRFITHMKKLKAPVETIPPFLDRIKTLGKKLGPILFQLPPHWHSNPDRLEGFLQYLSPDYRYVFEFRDPGWFNDQIVELLVRYQTAFCIYDLDYQLSPKETTCNFVYIRLHGPDGAYSGSYSRHALKGWANDIIAWADEGKTVYCYFDNDQSAYAALNARQLLQMIRKL